MAKAAPPTLTEREEAARTRAALKRLVDLARRDDEAGTGVVGEEVRYSDEAPRRATRTSGRIPPPKPGHRRIEWVGEPSPFDNPETVWKLGTRQYDKPVKDGVPLAEVIRAVARRRIRRSPDHNREMTKDRDGLSRDWVWGPAAGTYVRLLPNADADKLLSGPSAAEFRDLDAPASPLALPGTDIRQMKPAEFREIERDAWHTVPAGVRLRESVGFDLFSRSKGRPEFHVAGTSLGDD